jgi:hypothetical protein
LEPARPFSLTQVVESESFVKVGDPTRDDAGCFAVPIEAVKSCRRRAPEIALLG